MALTLIEAAKMETGDVYRAGVIEYYAGSSEILQILPFEDIAGNAYKYNQEQSLPGVGFRGVNESYAPSTGVINPQTESLVIAGGELDVDTFIVKTMPGSDIRGVHERMKLRSLALSVTKKFIKGDSASDPREFDGLQKRLTGNQLIAAGNTANGTPLSLEKLDEAIDQTLNPTHIVMNKALRRKMTVAARDTTIGGYISYETNAFGQQVMMYNGLPIVTVDLDNAGAEILPFSEAATSGTATATSLYVLSVGDGAVMGIQNSGGMMVEDLGVLQSEPKYRTRVEWFMGLCILNGRAATRLYSISNAAITK
jgi:hypothetical protein